jgi:predicted Zn-dependent protease with MMP-like domain
MTKLEQFQQVLSQVYDRITNEPWFKKAENYLIVINETEAPVSEDGIVLATTQSGGYVPTTITYYLRNLHDLSFGEIYRITKHEFAHLWGMDEQDAQQVEKE